MPYSVFFSDRAEAGRRLAGVLRGRGLDDPVVYALPRGGVPVALEIARALKAPLDLVLVRKIGAPGAPELALGAVVDGARPLTVINDDVRRMTRAGDDFLAAALDRELAEIDRRRALYMRGRAPIDAQGRTAIVVDDGLATGATAKVALQALRMQGAKTLILAVPVAPAETLAALRREADEVVCLETPPLFPGVGAFYVDFRQVSDQEVIAMLARVPAPPVHTAP